MKENQTHEAPVKDKSAPVGNAGQEVSAVMVASGKSAEWVNARSGKCARQIATVRKQNEARSTMMGVRERLLARKSG